jgi:salicylate biosynthesis isochorismate synthase/menaquinone-specific isochorismate synthase
MAEFHTARAEAAAAELSAPLEISRPAFAWSRPGLTAAASGEAARQEGSLRSALRALESGPALPMPGAGPWFGAAAFHGVPGPVWAGFAPLRFTLPSLLSWSIDGRHFAAAFGRDAQQRLAEATSEKPSPAQGGSLHARVVARAGERQRWNELVARTLAEIRVGALQKVVIARAVDVEASAPIDADALLRALSAAHPTCRAFLLRSGDAAFLGATPELLCSVEGDLVRTEAIAGSARPGEEALLLGSRKDLHEHREVVDHLTARLLPLVRTLEAGREPQIQRLANVLHLRTPIEARLQRGCAASDVAAALHPTPAVCGAPQDAALQFLREHEGLDRGLYAGVVGWAGPGNAELAVALRCAIVRGNRARLFVGAGIVEGSQADAEWEETEMKARALLGALGVAR